MSATFALWKQNKPAFDCTFQCYSFIKNMAMDLTRSWLVNIHDKIGTREKVLIIEKSRQSRYGWSRFDCKMAEVSLTERTKSHLLLNLTAKDRATEYPFHVDNILRLNVVFDQFRSRWWTSTLSLCYRNLCIDVYLLFLYVQFVFGAA